MMLLRSLFFNICFAAWALLASVIFLPLFTASPRAAQRAGRPWALGALWLARIILGLTYEVRGREHIPTAPVIYACKHQSAWDTIIFLCLFEAPAYVLKRELLRIPGWGWYLWRMKMIAIDRSAGASTMKQMIREAKEALAANRPIVIYPEGTRTALGGTPHYHPGVAALYAMLRTPVVPVALNSGVFWGRNAFRKRTGRVVIEFLPAIAPGSDKALFMQQLEHTIETHSARLVAEAQAKLTPNP
jgi:1-acyl-sn-glycerol-3-phosphate acyltransferase